MKRSIKTLMNYSIKAEDGMKGGIKDILLDEERWIIRYLEVSYGGLFQDERVLIPRAFLEEPNWAMNNFPVKLKKEDIERCPKLEEKATISRAYEEKLSQYYGVEYYWPYGYAPPVAAAYPPRPIKPPVKRFSEKELDTSLSSFNQIKGYHIKATDDKIGHIEDIINFYNSSLLK